MDSNNNPPSARVSMTVKMPYECHHETELYAYMYGADVQYLEVDGLNHINTQWESYYILHRTGRKWNKLLGNACKHCIQCIIKPLAKFLFFGGGQIPQNRSFSNEERGAMFKLSCNIAQKKP